MVRTTALVAAAGLLAACASAGQAPQSTQRAPASSASAATAAFNKTIIGGQWTKIEWAYSLNPDCTVQGVPTVRVIEPPSHGTTRIETSLEYPNFSRDNQRYPCNLKKAQSATVFYLPRTGFAGSDSFAVEVLFPGGNVSIRKYNLTVR